MYPALVSCAIALTLGGASAQLDAGKEFRLADKSKNRSKFIRSNAPHYWTYMRERVKAGILPDYISFQGICAGDPHMGNFAPIVIGNEIVFVDIDFDDAGHGPLILDFVRYMITIKASWKDIHKADLEDAYVRGLNGIQDDPPEKVEKFLKIGADKYN